MSLTIEEIGKRLGEYEGEEIRIMEVCGSHTAAIAKYGVRSILSPRIRLISGPGCPVCVTPTAYVDRLIELASTPKTAVVSFGDLLRVPGSRYSLSEAKGRGEDVRMVYAPMDTLKLAVEEPDTTFVFAAVGFETTAPVYTLLLDEIIGKGIGNVKLLTSIKTMPGVLRWLLDSETKIDGFLAPGHVCAITGSEYFAPLAKEYHKPFAVSGFEAEELLIAIYGLVQMIQEGRCTVENFYPSVVSAGANEVAFSQLEKYFRVTEAGWRGFGVVEESGLLLKPEYERYDAGSAGLFEDRKRNGACSCGEILKGEKTPWDCPLFGKVCTPQNPQGACMVSYEGSCLSAFSTGGQN